MYTYLFRCNAKGGWVPVNVHLYRYTDGSVYLRMYTSIYVNTEIAHLNLCLYYTHIDLTHGIIVPDRNGAGARVYTVATPIQYNANVMI